MWQIYILGSWTLLFLRVDKLDAHNFSNTTQQPAYKNLYKYEEQLYDAGYEYICGVDEVGRGPLAGPVVVCACILPQFSRIEGLNDSKQLSDKKRRELYKKIIKEAVDYNIVYISVDEVDELNIYQATKKGMLEAIRGLSVTPDHCLIDAMPLGELEIPHTSIIHGDARCASVAAASIIAKVTRDNYMEKMDIKYPNYGFKNHKGYGTKAHLEALEKSEEKFQTNHHKLVVFCKELNAVKSITLTGVKTAVISYGEEVDKNIFGIAWKIFMDFEEFKEYLISRDVIYE